MDSEFQGGVGYLVGASSRYACPFLPHLINPLMAITIEAKHEIARKYIPLFISKTNQ